MTWAWRSIGDGRRGITAPPVGATILAPHPGRFFELARDGHLLARHALASRAGPAARAGRAGRAPGAPHWGHGRLYLRGADDQLSHRGWDLRAPDRGCARSRGARPVGGDG